MKYPLKHLALLVIISLVGCRQVPENKALEPPYPIIQEAHSERAMVVSAHPLATQVGLDVLRRGGNAADAAVAVQFALAVTYPRAGNIGGGGFMIIHDTTGVSYALDYRERAPAAAHRDMYLDSLGDPIEGLSIAGHQAVGVPGTVDGLYRAWDSLGRMTSFAEVVKPAIGLAEQGFAVSQTEADRLNKFQKDFLAYSDTSACPFIRQKWQMGDSLHQVALAATLRRIAEYGADGFYSGKTADDLVQEMNRGGGLITHDDLSAYRAVWRQPIAMTYRGYDVVSMPPPSSGGIILAQMLYMLEQHRADTLSADACEYHHLVTEIERRAYADRASYLGDMDHVQVDVDHLMDSAYLRGKMSDFLPDRATVSTSYLTSKSQLRLESFETTHTSIVDEDGMAVSVTTTLNTNYGSKVFVPGSGFFLNNEMDDFSLKPGVPNFFGLIGNEKNAIAPGKRMLSSMTPTIVLKDGSPHLVLGSPGGSTIITTVLQVIMHVIDHDMSLKEAVHAKRTHHQWLPDHIMLEPDVWTEDVTNCMRDKGHELRSIERIGLVKAIHRLNDGTWVGVGDPRSDDHAEGL